MDKPNTNISGVDAIVINFPDSCDLAKDLVQYSKAYAIYTLARLSLGECHNPEVRKMFDTKPLSFKEYVQRKYRVNEVREFLQRNI